MKITAYLRVSTDKQVEQGNGLDVQREAIKAWAKAEGHKIIAWNVDEGLSGSNGLDTRIALADALADVRKHRAAGLIVFKLDRLARDLIVQETLLAEVKRNGGQTFTTSAGEAAYLADDPDDPSRKLIRQILGAVNEYERSMIALRLRSGRKIKAERGGYAYGGPPYGWRAEGKALVPDEAEQEIRARMLDLRESGMSYGKIAETLNDEGISARRAKWYAQTVSRTINSRHE